MESVPMIYVPAAILRAVILQLVIRRWSDACMPAFVRPVGNRKISVAVGPP